MISRVLDFLVCPIQKSKLKLITWDCSKNILTEKDKDRIKRTGLNEKLFTEEIISGALINEEQKIYYQIFNGIPRMLTYNCGVFNKFKIKYEDLIKRDLNGYRTPNIAPPKGENSVIRSFSTEWLHYDWNPEKYWRLSPQLMFKSMKFMLDNENKEIRNKNVFEVGIGIGGIANYFAENEECELFGVDLGYAVDAAYKIFHSNIFLHIIQASAFCLPFQSEIFDYAYSQGVLHHSSDPYECFINISKTVKPLGFFYVWLYNDKLEYRNLIRSLIMIVEKILRPIIWPLPLFLQNILLLPLAFLYLFHQNILTLKGEGHIKYNWREAILAARDRFTPRYAFRFSEKEVSNWFKNASFEDIRPISKRIIPDYLDPNFYLATAIVGQKIKK